MTDAVKLKSDGEKSLYFTQAELEVMLELAGGPRCLIYRAGPPPDDAALTGAMLSLYRRGFLDNPAKAGGIGLSKRGMFFRDLRSAPIAVVLTARRPAESAAICYGDGETVWLLEPLSAPAETRLRRMERRRLESWLLDTGILDPPLLTRSDARELSALLGFDENGAPDLSAAAPRLRLEKYQNGGRLIGAYEILEKNGVSVALIREGGREYAEIYTEETPRNILDRAFRKGKL